MKDTNKKIVLIEEVGQYEKPEPGTYVAGFDPYKQPVKVQEVKIGNILEFMGKPCVVEGISTLPTRKDIYWLNVDTQTLPHKIFHFRPVDLTEEWLLKLGWEWYEPLKQWRFVVNDVWYQLYKREDHFSFTFVNLNMDETVEMPRVLIRSVHKLQNLVYAIYSHELIFN